MKQRTLKVLALTLSVTLGSLTVAAPALADGYHGGQRDHQPRPVDARHGFDHRDRDYGDHRVDDRRDWHRIDRHQANNWHPRREYRSGVNGDYVAMAITTGVILSILAAQH